MKKRMLAMILSSVLVLSMVACGAKEEAPAEDASVESNEAAEEDVPEVVTDEKIPLSADYTYVDEYPDGTTFDIITYYENLGVDCSLTLKSTGGVVNVPDDMTSELPSPNEDYVIGFSTYYTVDEVGAMGLDAMIQWAEIAGVELKVNDANYDQSAQNQAVEQWILEGVDGVILCPCDFYGVKESIDALNEAGIPVLTFNPALCEGEVYSVVMSECKEQGIMAGELLLNHLLENNVEMKGTIIYQSLPFVHPNAATRSDGFKSVFADYPDVEIVELTGTSVEEHYAQFESALMAYDDMIGAFGLYSAATVGMINAKLAAGSDIPITSIDNDKPILQAIYNGDCLGSACYSSIAPTFYCMGAMIELLNGNDIPSAYFYENRIVTKDNVEEMFEHYYPGKTLEQYLAGEIS